MIMQFCELRSGEEVNKHKIYYKSVADPSDSFVSIFSYETITVLLK